MDEPIDLVVKSLKPSLHFGRLFKDKAKIL